MFSHIKTSKNNKLIVTQLTNKLNLGAENVIARIALAYSLKLENKLNLDDLKDSQGKEYSKSVLFGSNYEIYIGMLSNKYKIHADDKNISKYLKLHIDHGLETLNNLILKQGNSDSFDLLLKLLK